MQLRRTLMPLLGTALVLAAMPGVATRSQDDLTAASACSVPDDADLHASSRPTEDGSYPHEWWVANPAAQRSVRALGDAVGARFGSSSKTGGDPTLTKGLIGVALDHRSQAYVVVVDDSLVDRGNLERSLRSTAAASAEPGRQPLAVRVSSSCHSAADLAAAHRTILARDWHPGAASASFAFDLDPYTSTFDLSFDAVDQAEGEALEQRLGDLVTVGYGAIGRLGRMNDGEPHYGGAGIRAGNESYNTCSSGFTVILSNGNKGSVTAGHCYNNDQNVYSGSEYYGVVQGKSGFPTYDMERIHPNGESFTNKIHVDPCCPEVRTVTGHGPATVGEFVCGSGMVTKAICGLEVKSTSATFCDASGCTPDLFTMRRGTDAIGRNGDSGGPIYTRPTTSEARIQGMIVAGDDGGQRLYAEKIATIKSHLNVDVAQ